MGMPPERSGLNFPESPKGDTHWEGQAVNDGAQSRAGEGLAAGVESRPVPAARDPVLGWRRVGPSTWAIVATTGTDPVDVTVRGDADGGRHACVRPAGGERHTTQRDCRAGRPPAPVPALRPVTLRAALPPSSRTSLGGHLRPEHLGERHVGPDVPPWYKRPGSGSWWWPSSCWPRLPSPTSRSVTDPRGSTRLRRRRSAGWQTVRSRHVRLTIRPAGARGDQAASTGRSCGTRPRPRGACRSRDRRGRSRRPGTT